MYLPSGLLAGHRSGLWHHDEVGSGAAILDNVFALFAERGGEAYGEAVSQTEHAVQAALRAGAEEAPPALRAAALLHDVGHLLGGAENEGAGHAERGAAWLDAAFGPEVTEPIRLHVAAKRYLCAVEPSYARSLSRASELSLKVQGGPFHRGQVLVFEKLPGYRDALRLRRWDEEAKEPGRELPPLEAFRPLLTSLLRAEAAR